jgi:hypothetical protein
MYALLHIFGSHAGQGNKDRVVVIPNAVRDLLAQYSFACGVGLR